MIDEDVYKAAAEVEFPARYYSLCRRLPVRDLPIFRCKTRAVDKMLTELGCRATFDRRDRSYSFDRSVDLGTLYFGFVIQHQCSVEFWFVLEQGTARVGSNYAVIARYAANLSGTPVPNPPYPRPEFHSEAELRTILVELFDLGERLLAALPREK